MVQIVVFSIAFVQGSKHGADPTFFEAKLKPEEEASFSLHISPEVIAETMIALEAQSIGSIYLEIPYDMEEYIFWEPHFFENVMPESDVSFDVFVLTPFARAHSEDEKSSWRTGGLRTNAAIR